jgi:hypothetical protein
VYFLWTDAKPKYIFAKLLRRIISIETVDAPSLFASLDARRQQRRMHTAPATNNFIPKL